MYNDIVPSFEDLSVKEKSFTIHHRKITSLGFEIYEDLNDLRGRTSREFFPRASRTNKLRSESELILLSRNREKLYLLFWIGAVELKKGNEK